MFLLKNMNKVAHIKSRPGDSPKMCTDTAKRRKFAKVQNLCWYLTHVTIQLLVGVILYLQSVQRIVFIFNFDARQSSRKLFFKNFIYMTCIFQKLYGQLSGNSTLIRDSITYSTQPNLSQNAFIDEHIALSQQCTFSVTLL